jgi:Predicted amidophosphoribosyltransferases
LKPLYTRTAPIEDLTILLVDDIVTTGSTLHQCGTALITGHPKRIDALALALTPLDP